MTSVVASSNYATESLHDSNTPPKFSEYRSRVILGDLPSDFLRIQLVDSQIYDPFLAEQANHPDPNFLGHFTLTIAEAKLIKNSAPLGLFRMDPYVRFQIGHISHDTPIATGGGKNPQWKISYRLNLFNGIDKIHVEIFDQRSFTEDNFIGECDLEIPREVLEGQTHQQWYPLMGRDANLNENQGDILLIMSFSTTNEYLNDTCAMLTDNPAAAEPSSYPSSRSVSSSASSRTNSVAESTPIYSPEDVQTIEEMFPTIDRQIIIDLLDQHRGNKDLVVNYLLQTNV